MGDVMVVVGVGVVDVMEGYVVVEVERVVVLKGDVEGVEGELVVGVVVVVGKVVVLVVGIVVEVAVIVGELVVVMVGSDVAEIVVALGVVVALSSGVGHGIISSI